MAWVTVDDVEKAFDKWMHDIGVPLADIPGNWHDFAVCLLPLAVKRTMNTTVYTLKTEHVDKGE